MYIFYHVFTVNHWKEILLEQLDRMEKAGMLEDAASGGTKHLFVSGDLEKVAELAGEGWIYHNSTGEPDTLNQLRGIIPDDDVSLYIHTKGVTRLDFKQNSTDWRKFMEYFVLDKWRDCVSALVEYDACGVNYWSDHEKPHFSGNFWWAKNSYLKTLPPVSSNRLDAEFWVGRNNPNVKCFKALSQAFYTTPCPEKLYSTQLSILIATTRIDKAQVIIKELNRQAFGKKVEVLYLGDNRWQTIGAKRQALLEAANGDYVCFVDDDDEVSLDYVDTILDGIQRNPDVFVFRVEYWHNGVYVKDVLYHKDFGKDMNIDEYYLRIPNHLMVIKRELALKAGFQNKSWQEDADFAKAVLPELRVQAKTNKTLYRYLHAHKRPPVDVIFLSNAKTQIHKEVTQFALDTLSSSQREVIARPLVVEQNREVRYNARMLYNLDNFNYNRFMNFAFRHTTSDIVVFANNDLEFTPWWLERLTEAMDVLKLHSASPVCRVRTQTHFYKTPIELGEWQGSHIIGHCLAIKRDFFEAIGGFDEDVSFWASENAYAEQVKRVRGVHGLVTTSVVNHLGGKARGLTLRTEDPEKVANLTMGQVEIFNQKYNKELFRKKGK